MKRDRAGNPTTAAPLSWVIAGPQDKPRAAFDSHVAAVIVQANAGDYADCIVRPRHDGEEL